MKGTIHLFILFFLYFDTLPAKTLLLIGSFIIVIKIHNSNASINFTSIAVDESDTMPHVTLAL